MLAKEFQSLNVKGAIFLGCTFPESVQEEWVVHNGGHVEMNSPDLPFKVGAVISAKKEDHLSNHLINNSIIDAAFQSLYVPAIGDPASR